MRDHAFPFALVLVFPILNGLFFYLLRAPTPEGRPVMDQIEGFRMYMETAESGRLNIADAPEITTERFEALLPYAVALDVERPWANAFASALARAHPGDADPMSHYHSRWRRGGSWSSGSFGRSIASAVASATSAATQLAAAQLVRLIGIFRRLGRWRRRPRRRGLVSERIALKSSSPDLIRRSIP